MFELGQRFIESDRATAYDLFAVYGDLHFIFDDELWRDGQVGLPVLNPVFGIAPVALGGVRDLSQHTGFLGFGPANLNANHRNEV